MGAEWACDEADPTFNCALHPVADFTHNITDGLAMAASFYASPTIGATTTLACFAHEVSLSVEPESPADPDPSRSLAQIPHEIADYSILIKSG